VILEKLISLICDELDCDGIGEDAALGELVGDDIELQELISAVESEFDVELGDADGETTVGELAVIIEENINS
jgi:acyl carrier protein